MPLYDFRCSACDETSTLLLKAGEAGVCPACGSEDLTKLVSPFSFRGASTRSDVPAAPSSPAAPKATESNGKHVCTGGCQHSTADKLVKKYLGS